MKCLLTFPALLLPLPLLAAIEPRVRPVYDNLTDQRGTTGSGFLHSAIQGLPDATKAAGGVRGRYNDGAVTLEESTVGAPFATYEPSAAYVSGIVASVRAALYPPPNATRSAVAQGTAAFRYLSLIYSQDIGSTDITNHFEKMGEWYTDTERGVIAAQIKDLEVALSNAPLDPQLRGLLLDAYTDRAVAEMQFIKMDLEKLGRLRLGLQLASAFVIDEEIALLKTVSDKYLDIINQFSVLFSNPVEGVEPADFDPTVPRGIPFGYYIFQKEQPNRNQVRSRYFAADGAPPSDLPVYNEDTDTTAQGNAPGQLKVTALTTTSVTLTWTDNSTNETGFLVESRPVSGTVWPAGPGLGVGVGATTATVGGLTSGTPYMFRVSAKLGALNSASSNIVTAIPAPASVVPRPVNEILANGYRDYVTLLTVMGDYVTRSAELNRMRGLRQLPRAGATPGDLETARTEISSLMSSMPTNLALLRAMFSENQDAFQPGNTSGIFAARTGIETALGSLTNTRTFLSGSANMLGLDPNFLILLQTASAASYDAGGGQTVTGFDSFAQIVSRLRGDNRPLTVALSKKAEAAAKYNTYRESVDQVVGELYQEAINYADRFIAITGYDVSIFETPYVVNPAWDGVHYNPDPNVAKVPELKQIETERNLLNTTLTEIKAQLVRFDASERQANDSLALAKGLDGARTTAESHFLDETKWLYGGLAIANATAAGAQASAESVYAGASASTPFGIGATAAAGAMNALAQAANAAATVKLQEALDKSGRTYETTLSLADNALTVSQAGENLLSLHREKSATVIQQQEVMTALAQLAGRDASLRAELIRLGRIFDANNEYIRGTIHANPIHFVRSQSAILDADAAFADAQRWMFYAQRALEHKWTQRFAVTSGGKNYDSGSIFKMRNADELQDLLTAYFTYDANHELGQSSRTTTSVISLMNHVVAPDNPRGSLRCVDSAGGAIPQITHFRQKLASPEYRDSAGNITIPINTALLQDVDGLFQGPVYGPGGAIIGTGQWRDKIVYVKVNIVAQDGRPPGPGGLQPLPVSGSLSYGGLNYFRTRVVPGGTTALYPVAPPNAVSLDRPGEFTISTFHHYTSTDLNNVFVTQNRRLASGSFAYSSLTAKASFADPTLEDVLGESFQFNDFKELSVAATGWTLTIFGTQITQQVNLDRILDIELIIRHRSSSREVSGF